MACTHQPKSLSKAHLPEMAFQPRDTCVLSTTVNPKLSRHRIRPKSVDNHDWKPRSSAEAILRPSNQKRFVCKQKRLQATRMPPWNRIMRRRLLFSLPKYENLASSLESTKKNLQISRHRPMNKIQPISRWAHHYWNNDLTAYINTNQLTAQQRGTGQ